MTLDRLTPCFLSRSCRNTVMNSYRFHPSFVLSSALRTVTSNTNSLTPTLTSSSSSTSIFTYGSSSRPFTSTSAFTPAKHHVQSPSPVHHPVPSILTPAYRPFSLPFMSPIPIRTASSSPMSISNSLKSARSKSKKKSRKSVSSPSKRHKPTTNSVTTKAATKTPKKLPSPSLPSVENPATQASLLDYIRAKAAQDAVRRVVELIHETESGLGPWGVEGIKPCAQTYRVAFRTLIRAQRADLVIALWKTRREFSKLSIDPVMATACIRCVLRDVRKRGEKTEGLQIVFDSIREETKRILESGVREEQEEITMGLEEEDEDDTQMEFSSEGDDDDDSDSNLNDIDSESQSENQEEEDDDDDDDDDDDEEVEKKSNLIGQLVLAYANLTRTFLSAVHRNQVVKDSDLSYANECLSNFFSLSDMFPISASQPVEVYNELIRMLGKARQVDLVFRVLDVMTDCNVRRDGQTFEFLANATVRQVNFVTGAVDMQSLPEANRPEIAFVGRSNVGKSSLVNMVTNRRALAYVSGRPGKTQQFNYFLVNELDKDLKNQFYLVDLPGVGYAKVPQQVQNNWLKFMRAYFMYRDSLTMVFHLVDGRHGALKDDEALMKQIGTVRGAFRYVVVLTKMDKNAKHKVKKSVLDATRAALARNGCDPDTPIVPTSSMSKLGRDDMWRHLRSALAPNKPSNLH